MDGDASLGDDEGGGCSGSEGALVSEDEDIEVVALFSGDWFSSCSAEVEDLHRAKQSAQQSHSHCRHPNRVEPSANSASQILQVHPSSCEHEM